MNDYYAVRVDVTPCSADATDLLAAMLGDAGYESFVPDDRGLTAYIPADDYAAEDVDAVLAQWPMEGMNLKAGASLIQGRDWNAEWERHYFQPIVVGGRCVIHSTFHTDYPRGLDYEIVIDPKMAFGTGHHATTSLMVQYLLENPVEGLQVTDMGTGTAILAILAVMRGAHGVSAVEIDPAAWENAVANVQTNGHPEVDVRLGDASQLAGLPRADLLLANINRNIVVRDLPAYASSLSGQGSRMVLSGFYERDIPTVVEAAVPLGLAEVGRATEGPDRWARLTLEMRGTPQ